MIMLSQPGVILPQGQRLVVDGLEVLGLSEHVAYHVCMYHIYIYIFICLFIYRERERYINKHIYIYREIDRERERETVILHYTIVFDVYHVTLHYDTL